MYAAYLHVRLAAHGVEDVLVAADEAGFGVGDKCVGLSAEGAAAATC
jgi:hypothetical protein